MADAGATDAAAPWREMVGQREKGVNALATGCMASKEFSREANRVMSAAHPERHAGGHGALLRRAEPADEDRPVRANARLRSKTNAAA